VKGPFYISTGSGRGACCSICGCLVDDMVKHDSFHAALARLLGVETDD
jgi:hypothetical protein